MTTASAPMEGAFESETIAAEARSEPPTWLLLPILALPLIRPLLTFGLPRASDTALHMLRLQLLDEHLRAALMWPRWLPEMTLGYGYPFFSFYAPATYAIAEVLHLSGLSVYTAFQFLSVAIILLSGLGAWLLARDMFEPLGALPALIAAVAYQSAPYLLINVYLRGAFGEALALALLPLLMWCIRRLLAGASPTRFGPLTALVAALLLLSHTISLLLIPPFLVGYAVVLWFQFGRPRAPALWTMAAAIAALGVSAFFWLSVISDRSFITDAGIDIARTLRLPSSMWTWGNLLDNGLFYSHDFIRPPKLGLVQLTLGIAGFVLVRRRTAEWWFLLASALAAAVLMGRWALPLWQNSVLGTAQVAWRMLGFISLSLALFTGGIAQAPVSNRLRNVLISGSLVLLLISHSPRLSWLDTFDPAGVTLTQATLAQTELDKGVGQGGETNSNVQEFRPLSAPATLILDPQDAGLAPQADIRLLAANSLDLDFTVSASAPLSLPLTAFYYPGWQAILDGTTPIALSPSTNLGLLTLAIPAGEHHVAVRWSDTRGHRFGVAISMSCLALLTVVSLTRRGFRLWALPFAALLTAGLVVSLSPRSLSPVTQPVSQYDLPGLELLGTQVVSEADAVNVRLFWRVLDAQRGDLQVRLALRDADGALLNEVTARPFFNTGGDENWPVGALVDDAYEVPLPRPAPAGDYSLEVLAQAVDDPSLALSNTVSFRVEHPLPEDPLPDEPIQAEFAGCISLGGYSFEGTRTPRPGLVTIPAGNNLLLDLHWTAQNPTYTALNSFAHLLDPNGQGTLKEDQIPGPVFRPTGAWMPSRTWSDHFRFAIGPETPSGLLAPWVGLTDATTGERIPVRLDEATSLSDEVRLPAVKIVNMRLPAPKIAVPATFDSLAQLQGYTLEPDSSDIHAGDVVTVTLHMMGLSPDGAEFNRFLHLYNPQRGIVAQADGVPSRGSNPTSTWMPSEAILDTVPLMIGADADAGEYELLMGLYDPTTGERDPVTDHVGNPIADNAVRLGSIRLSPAVIQ